MKVIFCELPPALRVGGLEKAARELEEALRSRGVEVTSGEAPDLAPGSVVHFHGIWSPAHARLTRRCQQLGIPYLISPHGMLEPWAWRKKRWKKFPYFYAIERARLRRAFAVLATAPQEGERLAKLIPGARVEVRTLGSHLKEGPAYAAARAQLGWGPQERVLLYLSRIHPKKGLRELLEALAELPEATRRGHRLVVVGEGEADYVNLCRQKAQTLEPSLRVDWVPAIWGPEKWAYLQGADLMCLPTYSENFGLVVLEACQVGTPVLTTVETPWSPLAENGFGWVVPPTVSAYRQALADFLAKPIADAAFRERLAAWTRQHYAWSEVVTGYQDLYAEALRQPQPPRS